MLLIDEVHHISESGRGATLEAVIVRMRTLCDEFRRAKKIHMESSASACTYIPERYPNEPTPVMRIVALSATLPNVQDIGEWLLCPQDAIHYFDDSFRPVPLTTIVQGYNSMGNSFLFEKSLDDRVADVIRRHSKSRQVLIFCSSKKGCETLAGILASSMGFIKGKVGISNNSFHDPKLGSLISKGYAYHHAGVPGNDRTIVENLFISGAIHVLCATSTLAQGVNLPAHLVIIKGTNQWLGGGKGYEPLGTSTILQMTGIKLLVLATF